MNDVSFIKSVDTPDKARAYVLQRLDTNRDPTSATSEEVALLQLISLEYQWKQANASGDLTTLQRVFADEFTNVDFNGKTYNKAQWIAEFKGGEPEMKDWTISEQKLTSLGAQTATMTFTIAYGLKRGGQERSRDTDTFVRRDARWQVAASQSTPLN